MRGEFYKMDFRAWNMGTVDLTLEQEAAYLRLCHAMYDVGGPVPNSTRFLQAIFRCGNTKAAVLVKHLIEAGKIATTADGKLFNHRVAEELQDRERVSSARRAAGERGGSAPRANVERPSSDPRLDPERSPTEHQVAVRKPLKDNDPAEAIASKPGSREEKRREERTSLREGESVPARKHAWPVGYQEIAWERYGKKVDKQQGMSALEALFRSDRVDWTEFIAGIDRQAVAVPEPRYRPSLERFIKRQKWTDQQPESEVRNGAGANDLFLRQPARRQHNGSSFDAVTAGMARVAARRGLGPGGSPGSGRPENGRDHRTCSDDPEIEDADWSPAQRYSAAHH